MTKPIACVAATSVWLWLWYAIASAPAMVAPIDLGAAGFMHRHHSPILTGLSIFMAGMGSLAMMGAICVSAVTFAAITHRRPALALSLTALGSWGLIEGIKAIVQRPRPHLFSPLIVTSGYAFPSGHALFAMSVYGLIAYVAVAYARSTAMKSAIVITASVLIMAIGLSRIYLGVHYVSDVVAGWALGADCLVAGILLYERLARSRPNVAKSSS